MQRQCNVPNVNGGNVMENTLHNALPVGRVRDALPVGRMIDAQHVGRIRAALPVGRIICPTCGAYM